MEARSSGISCTAFLLHKNLHLDILCIITLITFSNASFKPQTLRFLKIPWTCYALTFPWHSILTNPLINYKLTIIRVFTQQASIQTENYIQCQNGALQGEGNDFQAKLYTGGEERNGSPFIGMGDYRNLVKEPHGSSTYTLYSNMSQ